MQLQEKGEIMIQIFMTEDGAIHDKPTTTIYNNKVKGIFWKQPPREKVRL